MYLNVADSNWVGCKKKLINSPIPTWKPWEKIKHYGKLKNFNVNYQRYSAINSTGNKTW